MSLKADGHLNTRTKVEGDSFLDGRNRKNSFAEVGFGASRLYLEKRRVKYDSNSHSRQESHGRKMEIMDKIWIANALNSHIRKPHFTILIKERHLGL